MNPFFEVISQIAPLSVASQEALTACLKKNVLPKGHILVKKELVCTELFFIEKGLARTFYIKDGKEITEWLNTDNTFACCMSFLTRTPDKRSMQLLEPSIVWSLRYEELESLYQQYPDIKYVSRCITTISIIQIQKRLEELHFTRALERYQSLIKNQPNLIQKVPLGMLASYLGMTQETLSRVRRQL